MVYGPEKQERRDLYFGSKEQEVDCLHSISQEIPLQPLLP